MGKHGYPPSGMSTDPVKHTHFAGGSGLEPEFAAIGMSGVDKKNTKPESKDKKVSAKGQNKGHWSGKVNNNNRSRGNHTFLLDSIPTNQFKL